MKNIIALIATMTIGLSGCVVVPDIPSPQVVITGGNSGYHCPPGQAKKGRC